ncbi:hypothetical protein N9Y42_00095 [Mariniblastus sp.]|nr:hypothetical protein [Mariniblastus sp.]
MPLTFEPLETRSMLAAVFDLPSGQATLDPPTIDYVTFAGLWCREPIVRSQPSVDPAVGAVVTAFVSQDPENPEDNYDILTGWLAAVDELHSIGVSEVSFGVYRQVEQGVLSGGPSIQTVATAVAHANQKNLSVTILPIFETAEGWRGDYDPEGEERTTFQNQYSQWISELAQIEGVDRLNIGSELNQMVANSDNAEFFTDLIDITQQGFEIAGNESGRIGYAANHDAFSDDGHRALFSQSEIDFIGISAYKWLTPSVEADSVAGTDEISPEVFDAFVENWTDFLDDVELVADEFDLPVVIQEVGAVQRNYASVAPFAVQPGDFVADELEDRYAFDPTEQEAIFKSMIVALGGRGDTFESVTFWTWEHQASRGRRTTDVLGTEYGWEPFAIYPDDGGGGEFLAEYLAGNSTAF